MFTVVWPQDQSAENFLQAYSRFVALRGHPRKLWSDRGTNFVGAKSALHELYKHLACLQAVSMEDVAAKNGTEWRWNFHPADAPHRNGAAEAAVKLLKRALTSLGGATKSLTWGELQTMFYQAANLTNERPIDARAQVQEDSVEYLTPNSLILGRASLEGDTSGLDFKTHPIHGADLGPFKLKWTVSGQSGGNWLAQIYLLDLSGTRQRGMLKLVTLFGLRTQMP